MATLDEKDLEIVRRSPLFENIPNNALRHLLSDSYIIEETRGKLLFLRSEPAEKFYLLLDGWVKVFRDNAEGEQTVIAIMKPGETVAEAAIFLGQDYPASCEVVDSARLLEIPAAPFLTLLRKDGDLAIKMLANLSQRLRHLVLHIEQLQANSTQQRLGQFLLGLCDAKEGSATIKLPYDKSLVAARLGMKPESLSRALAKLRSLDVMTNGNIIELGDIAGLQEFCRSEDDE
ncbi:MAG: cyclic nucleotide-binding domain-containing protein [Rhodospirillales bacterium]|nr:cyclic nucleotide-binding domain-containing protein [Rhodospirillales bacterium]